MDLGIELICTLGPFLMNERKTYRLAEFGTNLFHVKMLNLSHTKLEDVNETVRLISDISDVPICLDTEEARVRTGTISKPSKASRTFLMNDLLLVRWTSPKLIVRDFLFETMGRDERQ